MGGLAAAERTSSGPLTCTVLSVASRPETQSQYPKYQFSPWAHVPGYHSQFQVHAVLHEPSSKVYMDVAYLSGAQTSQIFAAPSGSSLSLSDLGLVDGRADSGGALQCDGCNVVMDRVKFRSNQAVKGGAIQLKNGAVASLRNCTLWDNTALQGASVHADSSVLRVEGGVFHSNKAGGKLHRVLSVMS